MNLLVAFLLLVMEEEPAFWVFVAIMEDIMPPDYYTPSLLASQADQRWKKFFLLFFYVEDACDF